MDIAILSKYWFWYLLAAVAAVAVGIISYRTTFPPVSSRTRIVLAAVRGSMVLLIGMILLEPVLNLYSSETVRPKLALLFDDSRSMELKSGGSTRLGLADSLTEGILSELDENFSVFAFSGDLSKVGNIPSKIDSTGDATSMANALENLRNRKDFDNFGSVLLVSDGRQNLGPDPVNAALKLGIPIHTLTVGDKSEEVNVSIEDVISPAQAYSDDIFQVQVQISGEGVEAARSRVFLKLDGKTVAERPFDIPREGRRTTVQFEAEAPEPGLYKYTVSTPILEGEKEKVDNQRVISVNVLKNRIKALLITDALDWEYKFIRQFLSGFDEFETDAVYPSGDGRFSDPGPPRSYENLEKYDIAIFVNCDPSGVRIPSLNVKKFADEGGAVIYVAGSDCLTDMRGFDDLLPLEITNPFVNEGEFIMEPSLAHKQHAAILLDDDPETSARLWRSLPPLNAVISGIGATGQTILESGSRLAGRSADPILIVNDYGYGRVAVTTGFPFWRCYFAGRGDTEKAIPLFWRNLVKWATARHDAKNFEIVTDRDVYRLGEPVSMTGYLYDEAGSPKGGALLEISILPDTGDTPVKDAVLTQSGKGVYKGGVSSLPPGNYRFEAYALSFGDTLGTTSGEFTIEEFSLELASSAPDYNLTRRISEATGGKAYTADEFSDFAKDLQLTPFEREKHSMIKPFGMPLFLIIVLCGLCIEWGVRKRLRLP